MDSVTELKAKRAKLASEARSLCDRENITPGEDVRLSRLMAGIDKIDAEIAEVRQKARASVTHRDPGFDEAPTYWKQTTRSEVFSAEVTGARESADYALRAADLIEEARGEELRPELRSLFEKNPEWSNVFRSTSDDAYASAFGKMLTYGEKGAFLRFTDAERQALERTSRLEARAMNVADDDKGGWAIPQLLSTDIVLVNGGAASSIRNLARVVTGVGSTWRGLASEGVTASWLPEFSEATDDSPVLSSPVIKAEKAAAWIPYSHEIAEDWQSMLTDMRRLLADAKDRLEAEAFIYGSGTNQPWGAITRAEGNPNCEVIVTTSGTIGSVDLYSLMSELSPRYRSNSTFLGSLSAINAVRKVSGQNLGDFVGDLRDSYNQILFGRQLREESFMDEMVNGTQAATFLALADWNSAFIIFDRIGSGRISFVENLMGTTNQRPIGASGAFFTWRVGSDTVFSDSTDGTTPPIKILVNKTS